MFNNNEIRLVVTHSVPILIWGVCALFLQSWASLSFQSALLKKVLARLGATIGSAGATTLSLTTEEFVVVELERRVFCSTCMSFVRKEVGESELSGIVSGATVAAEKVAWLEGRRVRKWWIGWVDMVVAGMVVAKGCLSVGMRRFSVPGLGLRLRRSGISHSPRLEQEQVIM